MDQSNPLASRFAAADVYEHLTGGWPARVSKKLISSIPVPITSESVILDNCCGSGAITTAIVNETKPQGFIPSIHPTDISPGMVDHVTKLYPSTSEIKTQIMDAQALKFEDNTFTHVFCAFGVFFCPDYELGYREMYRVAAPGSVTVITSWKVVGWVTLVNYLIKQIRPEQEEWKFPAYPGFKSTDWVKERVETAGWKDVEVKEVEDYTGGTKDTAKALIPMLREAVDDWSDEEKGRFVDLFDEACEACGVKKGEDEGVWEIEMVALAVTGRK